MPAGGARPGAGRKPGIKNRLTKEQVKAVAETGQTPLEFLLEVMRDAQKALDVRLEAAKAAAPYVHAKLAQIEARHTGQIDLRAWMLDAMSEGD